MGIDFISVYSLALWHQGQIMHKVKSITIGCRIGPLCNFVVRPK